MNESIEIYEVEALPVFTKKVQYYIRKKKYRHLDEQVDKLMDKLAQGDFDSSTTPSLLHSDIPTPYDIYKMRMANPDANEGKSGGYRVIYMIKTAHKVIVLMTIYAKSEQETISDQYVEALVQGYFMQQLPEED
jgi:mRNA-degrading endonuclease RelE of RelBE toxin-antitoxin system